MTRFHFVSRRTGVTASVRTRKRSAQMPGLRLERFGGIGAEEVVEKAVRQIRGGNQRRDEKQDFRKALHGVDQ